MPTHIFAPPWTPNGTWVIFGLWLCSDGQAIAPSSESSTLARCWKPGSQPNLGNAGEYLDMDLEKAIRFGLAIGPTIIPAGRIIAPFGGQFWDAENPEYYFADSRDEMRKAIRENIYWGAKVIKIVVDGQKYAYSTDDIRFIVNEAAAAGRKVAAHVQTERGAHSAIEAGVASIEHACSPTILALCKTKQGSAGLY